MKNSYSMCLYHKIRLERFEVSMKNKKVVITGGAGFIGSHLAEEDSINLVYRS